MRRNLWAVGAAAACLGAAGARAQDKPPSAQPLPYDRVPTSVPDTPVLDRAHPGFAPVGETLGSFVLYPSLGIGEVYDDNIYATSTGQIGDFRTNLDPGLSLASNWSRNMLRFDLQGDLQRYFDRPNEAVNNGQADIQGRYDAPDYTTFSGLANYSHLAEPRSSTLSPRDIVRPIEYDAAHIDAQVVKPIDRFRLSLTTDYYKTDYQNGETPGGQLVNETLYNNQEVFLDGNLAYVVNPTTYLVLDVIGNDRKYDQNQPQAPPLAPLNRNSAGYDITAGVNADITHVIRAQILVGYLDQTYSDSTAYKPVTGPSAHVKVTYLPTTLTTVSLTVERKVGDAQDPVASSFIATNAHLQIDHELYRYIIVSGSIDYADNRYKGITRDDETGDGHLAVSYLINHHLSANLSYDHIYVSSTGAARIPGYNINQVAITLTARY